MKTLLYITPHFPPSSAIGARRALNIARHIDRNEWKLVVLSAPVPSTRRDPQLESLVPSDVLLSQQFNRKQSGTDKPPDRERKPSSSIIRLVAEKGPYYIPLDEHMWHLPHAFRAAKQLVSEHRPDLILVNADPWSGLLLGHKLSKWSGIPWIADLRDPWTLHSFKMQLRPAPVRAVIRYFESRFFHSATRIVLNTQQCCEAYRNHYAAKINSKRMTWIRNAFDLGIYRSPAAITTNHIFSLHYFGSFRIYTDPDPLFHLLKTFIQKRRLTPGEIELVLYGEQRQRDLDLAAATGLMDYIRLYPAVSVRDALLKLATASVLVLVEGPNRKLQLPVKLYDYLAAGKPILALSDNPELDSILRSTSTGMVTGPDDMQDGLDKLELLFTGCQDLHFVSSEIEKYAVDRQISEFTTLFNQVLAGDS